MEEGWCHRRVLIEEEEEEVALYEGPHREIHMPPPHAKVASRYTAHDGTVQ